MLDEYGAGYEMDHLQILVFDNSSILPFQKRTAACNDWVDFASLASSSQRIGWGVGSPD